jgi:hypothetical protein
LLQSTVPHQKGKVKARLSATNSNQQDARKAQAHKPSKAQMPSERQQHDCVLNATNDQQASQTQETNVSKLAMIEETQSLRHSLQ